MHDRKARKPQLFHLSPAVLGLTLKQAEIVEGSLFGKFACRVYLVNDKLVRQSYEVVKILERATASSKTEIFAFLVG
jgi:hypothetical protein